jgi:Lon protease-like protein
MPMNASYAGPGDLPAVIPVFPLAGALLLPRGQMPLNIFEPRYLAMVDFALQGPRIVGMVQPQGKPDAAEPQPSLYGVGCAGRIVQFAETGDGRCLVSLAGVARFEILDEVPAATPFRQCRVSFDRYALDLQPRTGEDEVDRVAVLDSLRTFTTATGVTMEWDTVERMGSEALVNVLSMLAPFGVREKQALLEAESLRTRAEMLIGLTEMELAKMRSGGPQSTLQ